MDEKEVIWARSTTGEDFQCVHVDYAREMAAEIDRLAATQDAWHGRCVVIDELQDENDRLRAALKPFALLSDHYPTQGGYGNRPSSGMLWAVSSGGKADASVTVEDLHTAKRVLEQEVSK